MSQKAPSTSIANSGGTSRQQEGAADVDRSTSRATTSHVTRGDVDGREGSPAPTVIINWSPESSRNYDSSYDEPSIGSPTPSSPSPPSTGGAQLDGLGRPAQVPRSTARNSSDSSFEMVEHGSPAAQIPSPSSATDSPPDLRPLPPTSFSSPVSLPNSSQAPFLDPPPHLAISISTITPKAVRARAFSAIIPRHPSTLGSSRSLLPPEGDSVDWSRRRASHDGNVVRARTSLSPILSPIPDVRDEASLNPAASAFEFPAKIPIVEFPAGASFDFIIVHGKNSVGDLSREARTALGKIGLKSIPSLHGPLSLPYARCPSCVFPSRIV